MRPQMYFEDEGGTTATAILRYAFSLWYSSEWKRKVTFLYL